MLRVLQHTRWEDYLLEPPTPQALLVSLAETFKSSASASSPADGLGVTAPAGGNTEGMHAGAAPSSAPTNAGSGDAAVQAVAAAGAATGKAAGTAAGPSTWPTVCSLCLGAVQALTGDWYHVRVYGAMLCWA